MRRRIQLNHETTPSRDEALRQLSPKRSRGSNDMTNATLELVVLGINAFIAAALLCATIEALFYFS